jgi:tight adherence protein B
LILGIIFGAGIVWLGFNAIISNITTKQKLKFSMELPELLNILASALRAGLTLQQGLEAYASDSKSEVAREIRRAIGEIRVGTPIDEALMGVAKRMNSEDLEWAVTALSIQRVVGGSMATILTTTYETVKARSEIRREVRTLAAEGKLSAYVLMALPIGIFLFLLLTRREYVSAFWTNPMGYVLMAFVGVSMTFGWIWMKKIVEIKI